MTRSIARLLRRLTLIDWSGPLTSVWAWRDGGSVEPGRNRVVNLTGKPEPLHRTNCALCRPTGTGASA